MNKHKQREKLSLCSIPLLKASDELSSLVQGMKPSDAHYNEVTTLRAKSYALYLDVNRLFNAMLPEKD